LTIARLGLSRYIRALAPTSKHTEIVFADSADADVRTELQVKVEGRVAGQGSGTEAAEAAGV
jgi:hypothetical protein